jgi:hypothetical protein
VIEVPSTRANGVNSENTRVVPTWHLPMVTAASCNRTILFQEAGKTAVPGPKLTCLVIHITPP